MSVDIKIDTSELRGRLEAFASAIEEEAAKGLDYTLDRCYRSIVGGTYYTNRTGALSSSWKITRAGRLEGAVESGSKVAVFIDQGTKRHKIEAKSAKALRFLSASGEAFAKSVMHPGTKAKKIVQKETAFGQTRLLDQTEVAVERAIRRAGLD